MHELNANASAVVAPGLLRCLVVKIQLRNGFWQQVLAEWVEFCLQVTPAAKGVEDLIAWRNQQVTGVIFQGEIFGDHGFYLHFIITSTRLGSSVLAAAGGWTDFVRDMGHPSILRQDRVC